MIGNDLLERRPARRIAVLRALHLGDLLCATPALRALRRRVPDAEITQIGLPWAEELIRRLPSLDRLLVFPGYPGVPEAEHDPERTAAFFRETRRNPFDLVVQMHGDGVLSNGFVAELDAPVTVGYRRWGDDRLTLGIPNVADEPEVLHWLRLVEAIGGDGCDAGLEFPVTEAERRQAARLLAGAPPGRGPLVGIHAGASTPLRRWPAERFGALAETLVDCRGARIVLTGTAPERELTTRVGRFAGVPVLDLAGKTDLGTFAALLGALDLIVTNDTGASHLVDAAGTPSVVIFGTTSPHQWAPLDRERHLVVDARTYAPVEMPAPRALEALPIESVLLACERHLGPPDR
jgi:ADP-heptose:LPS heptosyltransferase